MSLPTTDLNRTVTIDLGDRAYDIQIGPDLLSAGSTYQDLPDASSVMVVTNATVGPLYGTRVIQALQTRFAKVHWVTLPDGEHYKNWETLNLIFDALLQNQCDRKTILFALGGGVVGDMTGYAAASFMRGIRFVQLPTTLLSQVDSSVGGKTGINHPLGKNMIGAFYQPIKVVCDTSTLRTLPERELAAGLAEVIKYGPIADGRFLHWLQTHIESLIQRDPGALADAIERSCQIKAEVVGQDEKEEGLRAILNFGHTFGHAIEAGMGYGNWLHGEAVGAGMVMGARLSQALGLLRSDTAEALVALITKAGLPTKGPILDQHDNAGRYLSLMRLDKKSQAGDIRFVVIHEDHQASVSKASDAVVRQVIDACCA
jgi:3-dehydroquinate synthase